MKNILFIAPPSGGKGTLSAKLVENYGYAHISTGDLLRELDKSTPLGQEVQNLIKNGQFVSDEIVIELLKDKLLTIENDTPFILDGFPRSIAQAEKLEPLLKDIGRTLDLVIEIDVPYDVCLKRALGRVTCPKCKTIYNKFFLPPKVENFCDKCGETLVARSDDTEETYKVRYQTYMNTTNPLIDFYKEQGKYVKIDGINNTYETLVSVINNG